MSGYLPELNMDTLLLKKCRDPIVAASTVHGMCLGEGHCKFLSGTTCKTVPGSEIQTCQCKDGLKEDSRNPVTRLIPRCVLGSGSVASDLQNGSPTVNDDLDDEYGEYLGDNSAPTIIDEGDDDDDDGDDEKETTLVTKEQLIALISAALPSGPLDINLLGSALGFDAMALESFSELIAGFGPLGQEETIVKGGEGADDGSNTCQNEVQQKQQQHIDEISRLCPYILY